MRFIQVENGKAVKTQSEDFFYCDVVQMSHEEWRELNKRIKNLQSEIELLQNETSNNNKVTDETLKKILNVAKERANKDRDLRPKKKHHGYVVLSSTSHDEYYAKSNGKRVKFMVWITRIQTPFTTKLTMEEMSKLYIADNQREEFYNKIGLGNYMEVDDLKAIDTDKRFCFKMDIQADFKTGYWVMIYKHCNMLYTDKVDIGGNYDET